MLSSCGSTPRTPVNTVDRARPAPPAVVNGNGVQPDRPSLSQPEPAAPAQIAPVPTVTPVEPAEPIVQVAAATQEAASAPAAPATLPEPVGAARKESFEQWLSTFEQRALDAGISAATVKLALDKARFVPRIVELDRAQPEFTRPPWAYIDGAVSQARIDQGQALIKKHQRVFNAAAQRYGVPASVITAIWGMESNFGKNFGSFRAVDALATLAYDGRRADWASRELLIALKIIDRGDIPATQMLGSWAGAMGHTQFLPSAYQRFAVDADGDGKRDIWGSIADVIHSTANFLAQSGWKTGEDWGTEVRLPANFDYARAEVKLTQPTSAWAAEGVRSLDGSPLPPLDDASIITPAGARGPAMLVGNNFRTLLKYNNSNNYALAVALLAQQIDGGSGLASSWPRELEPLSRSEVRSLQEALNAKGFQTGTPDGVAGPATRIGLREYQKSAGLPADGYATKDLLARLLGTAAPR
ncbi:lytic murein transglycosylase [Diaphorobacter aerolatus]|uniref:Lytic murein transglycosylase n=1 Tax=Diaphorobacter aerolatus TaxID=1288495 RepID=A0A7H0GQ20_9BURK|nr:lytic murein transglycosylase [Diaphorobacter aerolatus]QNP50386.1 lytic murein transglycosylase [Diaphorobacter aerolatus]